MSRQQSRSSGDGAIDPSLVQKKRARHRLVGAICLSLIAAIVVPLVLESEPRPRGGDLPIELAASARPPADVAKPAGAIGAGSPSDPGATVQTPSMDSPAVDQVAGAKSAVRTVTPPAPPDAPPGPAASAAAVPPVARQQPRQDPAKPAARGEQVPSPQAQEKPPGVQEKVPAIQDKPPLAQDKPPVRTGEPDVLARLIERADPGAAGATAGAAAKTASRRFLVQIGAYSNVQSARTVSDRVVQVGLRPYQETVKTAQGDWIRVRVGPFASRQDAERAQQDLKRVGVTAAIIAL